ncbi:YqeG family HAD IIIA-type phosphatase [Vagococcus xieshaowenii]|uniref:YqeG family HAD IIIA-type phosphatase n=1 Tax=Vagococcus xieshaowenii TaxID=2562451 RepID=A0AAJ5JLJ0_9ENTE|nr:YqeG family HAD IIIA-type phosphatase [Vagococcus xieshaowenii]QCA28315.1 YqeG family HAD IIIA-type phosphatase [Vagococcus xieshaowenii]TFZ42297.1 YqeG family HAD IIIA-type phosphatase [Vagococcus xieshaowenii]
MFSKHKPTWMLEAIYQLTPEQLAKHQIKGILTDLDNTLIAWNNPEGTDELRQWIATMNQAGINVIVVSNNNPERVQKALESLQLDFVANAMKPFSKGIKEGVEKLGLTAHEVVMVGDQVMTDVRASNGAGVRSILVKPIVNTDSWKTQLNRAMEKVVMKSLAKQHQDMKWRSDLG